MKFFIFFLGLFIIACEKKDLTDQETLEIIHFDENYSTRQLKSNFIYGEDFIDSIKSFRKIISSENLKPIYKADFNQDGKQDYLVNLEYKKNISNEYVNIYINRDEGSRNCVVLLSNLQGYEILNLTKKSVYDIFAAKIVDYNNQKLIKLLNFKPEFHDRNDILKYDTLMMKNNELTEFVGSQNNSKISEIIFTKLGGYVPGVKYQLIIKRDSIVLNSRFYKNLEGKYLGNDNQGFDELSLYLNKINFKNLKDKYFIGCSDCSSFETKIVYGDNKTKTIYDYGEQGSLGLVRFYNSVDALMKKQNWKKIE